MSFVRVALFHAALLAPLGALAVQATAQATGTAPSATTTRLVGTVRAVSAGTLTVVKDDGSVVILTIGSTLRVQQLPPGGTDIKAAQDATVSDIAEGDRVLVAAHIGDAGALSAARVVLMKSTAIAENNASRQADWQKRGSGGLVTGIDPAAKTVTISSGTRKTVVQTSDRTVFRRYAPGSVKFEDAKLGKLQDIVVGDQLRVRGSKDVDTGAVAADEVVSGSFRNVAGTVSSVDVSAGTLTLKDLTTKKTVIVAVSTDSDLRALPPEIAARFAARARGAGAPGGAGPGGNASGQPASAGASRPAASGSTEAAGGARTAGGGAGRGDLSQMIPRMPKTTLAALKPGAAVMVVASGAVTAGAPMTAITLLSGVEPLLAASPDGASSFNLSPWSLGGGEAAATGGTQ